MTYELVLTCLKNEHLPALLRTAFCQLYLNLFVDINPYEKVNFINYTRVWLNLDRKALTVSQRGKSVYDYTATHRFDALKQFIKQYLREHRVQDIQDSETNSLTLSILVLLRHLFSFGFYTDYGEINDIELIITPLIKLLDGKTDLSGKQRT